MALAALANRAKKRLFDFVKAERSAGLPETLRPPDFGLTAVVRGWMQGSTLDDVLRASPVQDGDLIRNFRLVLQVLRQLEKATGGHAALHECVRKAYTSLDRDEVDAEAQMKVN
jgi:superfamily II RNA helicase